jgi:pyrroloquinoline quinone biosynthesis protein B
VRAVVLGAAAGGGFPQWNSNADGCRRARSGDPGAKRRTQASLAVSGDGERWFLINASPDLREQIQAQAILHPQRGLRSSPIEGVILTGADVDAIAGLLHMRERQAFTLYGSDRVLSVLKANPIFNVLSDECVRRETVPLGAAFVMSTAAAADSRSSCSMCRARSRSISRPGRRRRSWPARSATRSASRFARKESDWSISPAVPA